MVRLISLIGFLSLMMKRNRKPLPLEKICITGRTAWDILSRCWESGHGLNAIDNLGIGL